METAAWTLKSRVLALDATTVERYWRLCPDFVVEVRSETDRVRVLREKMREWIENGAQLAWLIEPADRTVEIYRPNASVEVLTSPGLLKGEGPVDGFILDLPPVWDPLGH